MRLPKGLTIVNVPKLEIAKLYDTNIMLANEETGLITLNTGGWKTKHTKKCMNLALAKYGLSVKQVNFEWFVMRYGTEVAFFATNETTVRI